MLGLQISCRRPLRNLVCCLTCSFHVFGVIWHLQISGSDVKRCQDAKSGIEQKMQLFTEAAADGIPKLSNVIEVEHIELGSQLPERPCHLPYLPRRKMPANGNSLDPRKDAEELWHTSTMPVTPRENWTFLTRVYMILSAGRPPPYPLPTIPPHPPSYIPPYPHTYKDTYMHPYLHTFLPTYIPAYLYTYMPTHRHTYLHSFLPTYLLTYLPSCIHTPIPTYMHVQHMHTYIHTYIHTSIHSSIHPYIHTTPHTSPQAPPQGGWGEGGLPGLVHTHIYI